MEAVCIFPQDPKGPSKLGKTKQHRQYDPSLLKPIAPRGFWRNRAAYMQSLTTFCVGVLNVWRFPWIMYQYSGPESNGGAGAFLLVYLFMMVVIGMPVMYLETALGQIAQAGPVKMWDLAPIGRGIGWSMFIVCVYIVIHTIMLAPWAIIYMLHAIDKTIHWEDCIDLYPSDNNTCIPRLCWNKAYYYELIPSETLFYTKVLWFKFDGIEDGLGSMHWMAFAFLTFTWILVYAVIFRSVRSIGKVVLIAAVLPLLIFLLLLMTSALLSGMSDGLGRFFMPVGEDFLNAQLWRQAAEQTLLALGLSYGLAIAMGSYINFRNPTQKDSCEFWAVTLTFSLLAGVVLFAFIGVLSLELSFQYPEIAYSGPGVPWVVLPEIMERLAVPHIWSILLFLMIFLITVAVVALLIETIATVLYDQSPRLRGYRLIINAIICVAGLLLCLAFCTRGGFYIVHAIDMMPASMPLLVIAAFEIFVIVYIYDIGKFSEDIYYMMKVNTNIMHMLLWRALPFILLLLVIVTWPFHEKPVLLDWTCPDDTYIVMWMLIFFALLPIPGYAIWWVYHCYRYEKSDRIFAPHPGWTKRFKQNLE